ncbi:hypothetical protein G6N76_22785 [Rhizobium daejeonense]|uniref:Uncharacterized protein n=1 Tax=Rhizobium daejeonense TaxID=240521 RepID=A0A6M1SAJ3_9HYPH|nr:MULTISPECIES: hypothetical protein [Rhizobiaceae]NGO66497.1 hypothetical protein [Rhizobium daejeonense]QRI66764.1 hypothetical protein JQ506_26830 [Shinella sp. PSBB067]
MKLIAGCAARLSARYWGIAGMKCFAASVFLVIGSAAHAGENPMWPTSLTWTCAFSSVIRCERSVDCETVAEEGELALDYRENSLTDRKGTVHPIKRHYVQTVAGSPIGSEVKIELDTNEVIWLSPADGAGVFSDNWIGAMLSPKAGVILQELRPLICSPTG